MEFLKYFPWKVFEFQSTIGYVWLRLVVFIWLPDKSSLLTLFPTMTTASRFLITHLYNHIGVAANLWKWVVTLMLSGQNRNCVWEGSSSWQHLLNLGCEPWFVTLWEQGVYFCCIWFLLSKSRCNPYVTQT